MVDLSSVDMAGHAYGSYSSQYLNQIERADKLIGQTIAWLEKKNYLKSSLVIVASDHGMKAIDHAYLLFEEEKIVPLIFYGAGVKKGIVVKSRPLIMDLAPTIAYALGVEYPEKMRARVLEEVLE
ncbi:alkaline phosphatase family protein [Patescibacteria group bacterium]